MIDLGVQAFRMSRFAGCWVGLKVVTSVADGIGHASDLDPARHRPGEPADVDRRAASPGTTSRCATIGPHAVPDQEALVAVDRLLAAEQAYGAPAG